MLHPSEILKIERKKLGLTQAQFAQKIGVDSTKISNIEYKRSSLDPDTAKKIESTFGIPFKYLFTGDEQPDGSLVDGLPPEMGVTYRTRQSEAEAKLEKIQEAWKVLCNTLGKPLSF